MKVNQLHALVGFEDVAEQLLERQDSHHSFNEEVNALLEEKAAECFTN